MKNQIIYNSLGLYAGPAPSHTGHFIDGAGVVNNNWSGSVSENSSLLFPLQRVIQSSYSINLERTNISNLGNWGTIAKPVLNGPRVTLNFDYHLMGLANEMRLGLLANVNSNGQSNGAMLTSGRLSLLSGLYSRDYTPSYDFEVFAWPLQCREPRNLFIPVTKNGFDLNDIRSGGSTISTAYKNTSVDVYGFGDCYLNSYRCAASVNQIPTVSVSMLANNVEMYGSGLCNDIPSVIPSTYDIRSGTKFSIPNNFEGSGLPTVLCPKDITMTITPRSGTTNSIPDLFFNFSDIKIYGFDFSFDLNRSPLYGLGNKLPFDYVMTPPILCQLNINSHPGDSKIGSLVSLIKRDTLYDIKIDMRYQRNTLFSGIGVSYEFLGAKLNTHDSNISISNRQDHSLSFVTEMNPLSVNEGVFITGYIGIPNRSQENIYLSGDFVIGLGILLFEDNDLFVIGTTGYRLLY